MTTANQEYFDIMVSHNLNLEQVKTGIANDMVKLLDASESSLKELIAGRIANITGRGQEKYGRGTTRRLNALLKDVKKMRGKVFRDIEKELTEQLIEVGVHEAAFNQAAVVSVVPMEEFSMVGASRDQIVAAAQATPIRGRFLNEWFDQAQSAELGRLNDALKVGFFEGRSNDEIVRGIFGTRSVPGDLRKSRNNVKTIVRTSMSTMASASRDELFGNNSDIIEFARYTATLDGRTSDICSSRDGNQYKLGEFRPEIPAHPNCRSIYLPILFGVGIVGNRPTVTDTRTREKREIDFRADAQAQSRGQWGNMSPQQRNKAVQRQRVKWGNEAIGTTPAATTYSEWFPQQSADFQRAKLGPTKYDLYTKGGLDLNDFVNDTASTPWTIDQLRAREADAFSKI
ncbi:MAG: hypothetical protein COA47_10380 [Robiginitomaculum sp.]|nr:MAG: hypothetical protein COA47_10380 [Robiginitomaculum sp.]